MPPHVAQATAEFLKSPTGVTQALFMARDEMHEIKEDRWDEAIWGSSDALASSSVSLKLYFAENVSRFEQTAIRCLLIFLGRLGFKSVA